MFIHYVQNLLSVLFLTGTVQVVIIFPPSK